MGAKYSIIQYLPDAFADERINIGVLVMEENTVKVKFLEDWRRVECFAGGEISHLKTFSQEVENALDPNSTIPGLLRSWTLTIEEVTRMADCWRNSIQITPPVGTTVAAESLLERMSSRYLKERRREARTRHDKYYAVRTVGEPLRNALIARLGDKGERLLRHKISVIGEIFSHILDIGVSNGSDVYVGSYGISFEINDSNEAWRQSRTAALAIQDIRAKNHELPLGVVLLPPARLVEEPTRSRSRRQESYESARYDLQKVGATLLSEAQANKWARDVVFDVVPPTLSLEDE